MEGFSDAGSIPASSITKSAWLLCHALYLYLTLFYYRKIATYIFDGCLYCRKTEIYFLWKKDIIVLQIEKRDIL